MEKTKQELIEEFLKNTYHDDIKSFEIGKMFNVANIAMAEPMETLNKIQNRKANEYGEKNSVYICCASFNYETKRHNGYYYTSILENEEKELLEFVRKLLEKRIDRMCKKIAENIAEGNLKPVY